MFVCLRTHAHERVCVCVRACARACVCVRARARVCACARERDYVQVGRAASRRVATHILHLSTRATSRTVTRLSAQHIPPTPHFRSTPTHHPTSAPPRLQPFLQLPRTKQS